jgi:asparagine N-glycosylation enzyme membrane subunit Stt3
MIAFSVFFIAYFLLHIIATIRISKMGGSGLGYFFFGWIYICCSSKADEWNGFNKTLAVIVGLLTAIGLPIYIIAVLKPKKNTLTDTIADAVN